VSRAERTTACAIDLALRHTGVLFWTQEGFEWQVFSTKSAPPSDAPYADQYYAQDCAEELADWLRDTVTARHDLGIVAVELATNAKDANALATMMLARGTFATVSGSLRRRGTAVEYVVQNHSRAAVLRARPKPVRTPKDATPEQIRAAGQQRQANRKQVKADVKRHVLSHFPELRAVERSVGASLEEHVLDAASVMVAASQRPSFADAITGARLNRLRNAFVNHNHSPCPAT
jgi:hypothetical protein